jgi:hypothetical protein
MMASMKMAVFWFLDPCALFHHRRCLAEAAITSETSVNIRQAARRLNPRQHLDHCATLRFVVCFDQEQTVWIKLTLNQFHATGFRCVRPA